MFDYFAASASIGGPRLLNRSTCIGFHGHFLCCALSQVGMLSQQDPGIPWDVEVMNELTRGRACSSISRPQHLLEDPDL